MRVSEKLAPNSPLQTIPGKCRGQTAPQRCAFVQCGAGGEKPRGGSSRAASQGGGKPQCERARGRTRGGGSAILPHLAPRGLRGPPWPHVRSPCTRGPFWARSLSSLLQARARSSRRQRRTPGDWMSGGRWRASGGLRRSLVFPAGFSQESLECCRFVPLETALRSRRLEKWRERRSPARRERTPHFLRSEWNSPVAGDVKGPVWVTSERDYASRRESTAKNVEESTLQVVPGVTRMRLLRLWGRGSCLK